MEDPLWVCFDSSKKIDREQLELVLQKKKITEVQNWFEDHFIKSTRAEYLERCPIVVSQGPTGCGKTSTLRYIANFLRVPLKEYSETTDTTFIDYELAQLHRENQDDEEHSNIFKKRKSTKFQHFVINSIQYNSLYSDSHLSNPGGANNSNQQPNVNGVIIHVETPPAFGKPQSVFSSTLNSLVKLIKRISSQLKRRIAVVFESLEGDKEAICLSTKTKVDLKIQVFKFNPITKANMKKLIDSLLRSCRYFSIDKETIEQIVDDSDGDIRACVSTLQLICNKQGTNNDTHSKVAKTFMPLHPLQLPAYKKQKLNHGGTQRVHMDPSLMRDVCKSHGFFHILGKIFYQKRFYPIENDDPRRRRSIDRPFPTENTTEHLVDLLSVEPENLIAWLHHNYNRFCLDDQIEKAALMTDNLSTIDTTCLNTTQSSQFYEMHHLFDQLQIHLAIEATVYSLYEDQSSVVKPAHKKVMTEGRLMVLKSGLGPQGGSAGIEGHSFVKPTSLALHNIVEDHRIIASHCTTKLVEVGCSDQSKFILDYQPYLSRMAKNWSLMTPGVRKKLHVQPNDSILDDQEIIKYAKVLDGLGQEADLDLEKRHEELRDIIDELSASEHVEIIE